MMQRIVAWLMGEATTGQRKMLYGTLALLLVWVFIMWAPASEAPTRQAGLETLRWIVGAVILGNVGEHVARQFGGKAQE